MPVDPLTIIGEILGEPAGLMRNPVNAGYQCPFINSVCVKRGHLTEEPYPVCSIYHGVKDPQLICACPKRFFGAELVEDVLENCWPGERPRDYRIAYEVQMKGFGNVDFVIADIDPLTNTVRNFVSVELQAVDTTGSVQLAYSAVLNNRQLDGRPGYGMNWGNVRKRYISQLVAKGYFHHLWGTRIVAVLQTALYTKIRDYVAFDEMTVNSNTNIIFMLYDFTQNSAGGGHGLELARVVGTSHSSLMTGTLYRLPPPRGSFCDRIIANLQ